MLTHADVGLRLKEARSMSNLTQTEAAEKLGISRQKLVNIEKGIGPIDTILLKKMSDLYGYSMEYFLSTEIDDAIEIKLAFRTEDLDKDDQQIINWARKILFNIRDLDEIFEEVN